MGKKIGSLITGILFAISLAVMGYLFMVLCIVLGIGEKALADVFLVLSFGFYPMALISIVGSALVFVKPKITKIMLLISLIYFVINACYILFCGAFSILYLVLILIILALGITSIVLASLIKKENKSNVIFKKNEIEILNTEVNNNNINDDNKNIEAEMLENKEKEN
ncbi:MAG: hypothetical protein E7359_04600 [Clostridiales bacterium]|nr:hypothetical protein [Clostridiales bacterium]